MFSLKIKKLEIFLGIGAVVLYLTTRLYNIMSLPLFTDEAIYTRWSQIARFDPDWRFISLTDGKQPLFVWINMIFMRVISDPLLSGRIVSVFAGLLTMIGLYFLGKELFGKKVGIITVFLYILFPFSLVYDRMALYDSLVAAGAVWSLFFEILLVKYKRFDLSLILGMILGASVLTKSSGFLFIYLLPVSLLLFDLKNKKRKELFMKWSVFAFVSVILAYGYYSILRLSPFAHIIDEKNTTFVYPIKDWITHPFNFFVGNWSGQFNWLITYLTIPVLILVLLSFFIKTTQLKEKLLLFSWFIFPFIALALFGRSLYPRYILFITMPLLVLAAFSLQTIMNKVKMSLAKILIFGFFTFAMIFSDYFILTDFARAPIPRLDLDQYIDVWPAGGGTNEIIGYLGKQAKKSKIYVASLGTFGSLPTYAVEIYLGDDKNVDKRGIYPVPSEMPKDLLEKAKTMPVYIFVSNQEEFEKQITTWPIKELLRYQKGIGKSYAHLYEVKI